MSNVDFLAVVHECAATSTEIQDRLSKALNDVFAGDVRLSTEVITSTIALLKVQTMLLNNVVEENQTIMDQMLRLITKLTEVKSDVEVEIEKRKEAK